MVKLMLLEVVDSVNQKIGVSGIIDGEMLNLELEVEHPADMSFFEYFLLNEDEPLIQVDVEKRTYILYEELF